MITKIMTSSDIDEIESWFEANEHLISDDDAQLLFDKIDKMVRVECNVLWIDYQIQDVNLVKLIDEKLLLLQLTTSMAYYAGINYQTVLGTLKPWDAIIFNSLREDNKVVPMARHRESDGFMGAYVKDPQVGYHRDILSFDLTSLYPSIIRECNISPETILGQLEYEGRLEDRIDDIVSLMVDFDNPEASNSANGMQYSKEKLGVIPVEIAKVFFQRKDNKKKSQVHAQNAEDARLELVKRGLLTA